VTQNVQAATKIEWQSLFEMNDGQQQRFDKRLRIVNFVVPLIAPLGFVIRNALEPRWIHGKIVVHFEPDLLLLFFFFVPVGYAVYLFLGWPLITIFIHNRWSSIFVYLAGGAVCALFASSLIALVDFIGGKKVLQEFIDLSAALLPLGLLSGLVARFILFSTAKVSA
jgi:hypothetical protein